MEVTRRDQRSPGDVQEKSVYSPARPQRSLRKEEPVTPEKQQQQADGPGQ